MDIQFELDGVRRANTSDAGSDSFNHELSWQKMQRCKYSATLVALGVSDCYVALIEFPCASDFIYQDRYRHGQIL
ncbi:hypothetical protein MPLDJ20_220004 [Mesorhizobium plurifarium]|uniref:Uncharacterized protein n=1 Tax=Mesorhizobium plurifarium TaxID=69974 RepID=A0A090F2N0_MESPL|nr:hypothetical protein MPLDJ20_220004 [Mesorhizobium plurifarium]